MNYIRCSNCGERVSTPVPENTIVRAWIECPKCTLKENPQVTEALKEVLDKPKMEDKTNANN